MKEEINIDNSVKNTVDNDEDIEHLLQDIDFMNSSTDNAALSEDSGEVSCYIAAYIAKKTWKNDMVAAVTNFWLPVQLHLKV